MVFYVALLALLTLKMWDHVETVRIYNQKKIFLSVISFDKGECRPLDLALEAGPNAHKEPVSKA